MVREGRGVPGPGGSALGGCLLWRGCLPQGGVPGLGGVCSRGRGVSALGGLIRGGGGGIPTCIEAEPPL